MVVFSVISSTNAHLSRDTKFTGKRSRASHSLLCYQDIILPLADGSQLTNWPIFPGSGEWKKIFQLSSLISEPLQTVALSLKYSSNLRPANHIQWPHQLFFLPSKSKLQLWGACTISKPTQQPSLALQIPSFASVLLATSDCQHTWTSWTGFLQPEIRIGSRCALRTRWTVLQKGVIFSAGYKADLKKRGGGLKKKEITW